MEAQTRQFIRRRAGERCEYCHLPQSGHDERFSIDHVVPTKHGGDDTTSNLAFCCLRCNLYKGSNLSGIDPFSGQVTSLFDPRRQIWQQHFRWHGPVVAGVTPVGRTTVSVMQMNAPERVQLRATLNVEGLLPPD